MVEDFAATQLCEYSPAKHLTHKATKCKMHIDAKTISEREHIRS